MTIKEFQVSLENKVKNIKLFTDPLKIASYTTTAQMGERIFDDGRTVEGTTIGKYDDTPMYINPLVLKTMNVPGNIGIPRGKTGKTKFASGKKKGEKHKTKYLEGGYKELRDKIGRQTAFVDLKLSGELRMDFSNGTSENVPSIPRKESDFEYQIKLDKEINQKKREGMEEKYGTIFSVSESEKELFFTTINFEFQNRLSQAK